MSKPQTQRPKPPPFGRTNLASYIFVTIFLIFVVIVILMFIPAGKIKAGQTQFMAATFVVQSFPVNDPNRAVGLVQNPLGPTFGDGYSGLSGTGGPTMEIESRLQMAVLSKEWGFGDGEADFNAGWVGLTRGVGHRVLYSACFSALGYFAFETAKLAILNQYIKRKELQMQELGADVSVAST